MLAKRLLALMLALTVFAGLGASRPALAESAAPTGLEDIDSFIEGVMAAWQVPGMAVGVIQNGQVVLAKGYGVRDIDTKLPVTPDTVFAIASLSKAFTTAAFQSLVEEGTLDWDTPIREYLPGLRLQDPMVTDRVTARDWASHRTGMPSLDLPFLYRPEIDLPTLMTKLNHVEPLYDFRTNYRYSNLGYVVLGETMRQATGKPWDAHVEERILKPLGMTETSFYATGLQAANDSARPYSLQDGKLVQLPYFDTTAAGPGGAINSSVSDLLKWLSFHLNHGRVGDKQLLSPAGVDGLHTAQITRPSTSGSFAGYSLGWQIEQHGGHTTLGHSGRNPGYGAVNFLVPQKGIGLVILTNLDASLSTFVVANHILDRLLDLPEFDWNAVLRAETDADLKAMLIPSPTAPLLREPEAYVGEYLHPVYGTVRVDLEGEQLQAVYYNVTIPLNHTGFGHFSGPISPENPINLPFFFETNVKGEITGVLVDFENEGKPTTLTRTADPRLRDPAYLQKLVGRYSFMGQPVEVTLNNNELSLIMPGQRPLLLVPHLSRFRLKDIPDGYVTFELDEKGETAVRLTLEQYNYPFVMERMK